MPENRFLRIVVLLLLLLNAGTLGFLLMQRPAGYGGAEREHPHDGGGPGQFLRHELQLTDEQERQYHRMRNAHHEQVVQIQEQVQHQQQRLYALLSSADTAAISTLGAPIIDSIGQEQRAIAAITFAHFREVRTLCTPAQQKKFDEVILEALSQLH